jgi:hypothetical protein
VIVDAGSYQGSAHYTGRAHVEEMFAAELSELVGQPIATVFTAHNVSRLYTYIKLEMYIAALPAGAAGDLAATTQHLALNSLQRGAAKVTVQMWSQPDALICEVVENTVIDDVLLGRRVPVEDEHDGLWHANQLCDLVQMRSSSAGTTVRIHAWKWPRASNRSVVTELRMRLAQATQSVSRRVSLGKIPNDCTHGRATKPSGGR